jgi:outer membrane murein-binding lipoprotein Lpp
MADENAIAIFSKKVDGLADEVRTNTYRLDKFEASFDQRFDSLGAEIENLTGAVRQLAESVSLMSKQFTAVTSKVIENDQRVDSLESRVAILETR